MAPGTKMLIKVHPDNPGTRQIGHVRATLEEGGIIIYPTDSVYAMGCDISNHHALEKLALLKGKNPRNADFSFIFADLSQVAEYTQPLHKATFKLLRRNLPGPFTFILAASNKVPKMFKNRKKTIGIRIPDCAVTREIVNALGRPLLTTSIHDEDEVIDYTTDPEMIFEKYHRKVSLIVDGGPGNNFPTTVVDCTADEPVVVREGLGILRY